MPMRDRETDLRDWFDTQARLYRDRYLRTDEPLRQSGYSSTPERWRLAREPILAAVTSSGSFLDIGCANGLLLESLMAWGTARGIEIEPHGIDLLPELINLARRRLPGFAANFDVANAFEWQPRRQYNYVHTLLEFVPEQYQRRYLVRLLNGAVARRGSLIVSSYGSRSRNQAPRDAAKFLDGLGFAVTGSTVGHDLDGAPITRVAWIIAGS